MQWGQIEASIRVWLRHIGRGDVKVDSWTEYTTIDGVRVPHGFRLNKYVGNRYVYSQATVDSDDVKLIEAYVMTALYDLDWEVESRADV